MAGRYRVPCLAYYPWVKVRVGCGFCPNRHGVYSLAARFGSETPMEDVLAGIAADWPCPHPDPSQAERKLQTYHARCYAYCPDLMGPPAKPPDLPAAMMKPRLIQGGKG